MTKQQAKDILGDRDIWELKAMRKALEMMGGFFNTPEDNQRLEAIKTLLKK